MVPLVRSPAAGGRPRGAGTGAPLATPLAWAVLAVTRRESANATTAPNPAAAVPAAAASTDLAGLATALGAQVSTALTTIAAGLSGATGATLVDFLGQSTSVPGVSVSDAVGIAVAALTSQNGSSASSEDRALGVDALEVAVLDRSRRPRRAFRRIAGAALAPLLPGSTAGDDAPADDTGAGDEVSGAGGAE